ncbi:MAG: hypothetical protein Fur0014_14720 [Rubrivivax sp.]
MDSPPALAPLVAERYRLAPPPARVRLLNQLLRHVGPLALVAIAAGAFSSLLPDDRWREAEATLDDVRRVGPAQVLALAAYLEQKAPEVLTAITLG